MRRLLYSQKVNEFIFYVINEYMNYSKQQNSKTTYQIKLFYVMSLFMNLKTKQMLNLKENQLNIYHYKKQYSIFIYNKNLEWFSRIESGQKLLDSIGTEDRRLIRIDNQTQTD